MKFWWERRGGNVERNFLYGDFYDEVKFGNWMYKRWKERELIRLIEDSGFFL